MLASKQTKQADVYYGGAFLTTAFVDYDPTHVEIEDPLTLARAIPNIKDPGKISAVLSGRQSKKSPGAWEVTARLARNTRHFALRPTSRVIFMSS